MIGYEFNIADIAGEIRERYYQKKSVERLGAMKLDLGPKDYLEFR